MQLYLKSLFNFKTLFNLILSGLIFCGCSSLFTKRIEIDSLQLSRGVRVLIAEIEPDGLGHRVIGFRRPVAIQGITVVTPSQHHLKRMKLNHIPTDVISGANVRMIFLFRPFVITEKRYDPYPVLKGWYKKTHKEGNVYRSSEEPVYETGYKFRCTRTTYRIYQYDNNGKLMGATFIQPDGQQQCPQTTRVDVHFDEIETALAWLKTNLIAK